MKTIALICPTCLSFTEVRTRPVAGTMWTIVAACTFPFGQLLFYVVRRCFSPPETCATCGAPAVQVDSPAGRIAMKRIPALDVGAESASPLWSMEAVDSLN